MPKLVEKNIPKLIAKHAGKGRMSYVKFQKADGEIRQMWFIRVSEKHLKKPAGGEEACKKAAEKNIANQLSIVYDIHAKGIRSFKWARVTELSLGGKKYTR